MVLNIEHFVIIIINKKYYGDHNYMGSPRFIKKNLQASYSIEGSLSLSISSPLSEKVKLVPFVSTPQDSRVYV